MLHVTNGDSALAKLRAGGMEGDLLAWRDALHEGPVSGPAERARFIADRGWAPYDETLTQLTERDERLAEAVATGGADHATGEPITLWFETDLHDVLQLAQIAATLQGIQPCGTGLGPDLVGRYRLGCAASSSSLLCRG